MDKSEILKLNPGDHHYMAYVGPPSVYDLMGATQFRLLCTLGLRSFHYVLDFGCGSLRAGRLLIPYLEKGHYCGIEPNRWLIEESIANEIGNEMVNIKQPEFHYNDDFSTDGFNISFNYIIAQSIFSHAGNDIIITSLNNFRHSLRKDGIIAVTFIEGDEDSKRSGWIYPDCVNYKQSTILSFADHAKLFAKRIPWFHPNKQTWYLFSKNKDRLPGDMLIPFLSGAILP